MNHFEWLEIDGKTVLKQDFSYMDHLEIMKFLNHSHDLIKDKGERDIIVVTNLAGVNFDQQVMRHFSRVCEVNKPFVSASAIYNATSIQRAAIESVAQLTNRHFLMFNDEKAIEEWLESLK